VSKYTSKRSGKRDDIPLIFVSGDVVSEKRRTGEEPFLGFYPLRLLDTDAVPPMAILVFQMIWRQTLLHQSNTVVINQQTLFSNPPRRRSVQRSIEQLVKVGWLQVEHRSGRGLLVTVLKKSKRVRRGAG
jgi:hypothetical protein